MGMDETKKLEESLGFLSITPIDHPSILEPYAQIHTWTHGRSLQSHPEKRPPKFAVPMGQNDLWIAAKAQALELTLLSIEKTLVIWERRHGFRTNTSAKKDNFWSIS